jgi:hypothetical protein
MKVNNVMKIILVVIILAVGGFFYYKKLLNPKIMKVGNLNAQILVKQAELATYQEVRNAGTKVAEQNVFYKKWTTDLYTLVPNKFDNNDNLQTVLGLLQLGSTAGVNLSALKILDPSIAGGGATSSKNLIRISKNVIGMTFSVDTTSYPSLQKFNDMLLNNFKNIIIPETYSVEAAKITSKDKTSTGLTYKETFTGYLLLSSDAKMPIPVMTKSK